MYHKKIRKKICQIFAVEYFPFNPSKYDVWNHCQVQGGVATSSTSEEHCNLLKSIKLFSNEGFHFIEIRRIKEKPPKGEHDLHHKIFQPFQRKNSQSR